jgi:hypothetical protein
MSHDRLAALGVGFMLAALVAYAAIGDEPPLCVEGHPAPRRPYVTYGGLEPRHGYQRDHWVPLCLGGPDIASNVYYQPIEEARRKDVEERELCEAVCRGDLDVDAARQQIMEDWRK